jgi:glyoxylase-like metal-dependent hydrolase (beta-lactamase superfamily II)
MHFQPLHFAPSSLALTLAVALPVYAQQDFSKVEIKTEKLNDSTYMLVGSGGNIGLSVGEDAVFVIDDQYAPLTPKVQAAIAAITPKPVRFVLNTHWHGDHTGGNENMGNAGAIIVAHDNVRRRLDSEQFNEFFRSTTPRSPRAALPLVTFLTDVTFHINGDEVRAFHVPAAHTDGDAIVHFVKGDVIHMGDILFNGTYTYIDTASGGTMEGLIAACDRVLSLATDKTKLIPGHGPLASREDLRAHRDMLATVLGRVKQMIREGMKLEDIVAAKPTSDLDEKWGRGFVMPDKFVEMVVMNLIKRS